MHCLKYKEVRMQMFWNLWYPPNFYKVVIALKLHILYFSYVFVGYYISFFYCFLNY